MATITRSEIEAGLKAVGSHQLIFMNRDLSGIDLSNFDLTGVTVSGTVLNNANLSGTILKDARLYKASLRGVNMTNTDLSNADMQGANFENAILSEARLKDIKDNGARFNNANMEKSTPSGGDFSSIFTYSDSGNWYCTDRTEFISTNMAGSDLSDANMSAVLLHDTKLVDTILTNCQLSGAEYDSRTTWSEGVKPDVFSMKYTRIASILDNKTVTAFLIVVWYLIVYPVIVNYYVMSGGNLIAGIVIVYIISAIISVVVTGVDYLLNDLR